MKMWRALLPVVTWYFYMYVVLVEICLKVVSKSSFNSEVRRGGKDDPCPTVFLCE